MKMHFKIKDANDFKSGVLNFMREGILSDEQIKQ